MIAITPTLQSQPWYLDYYIYQSSNPLIFPHSKDLLTDPSNQPHRLVEKHKTTLKLATWMVSGKHWFRKEFQRGLPNLSFHLDENLLYQVKHQPWVSGLAGGEN